jgi:hypothetical protein
MRQCRQGQAARTAFQSAEDRPKAVQPPHRQQMSCGASLAVAPAAHSPWPRPWRGVYHSHKGWRLPLASRQVNCASPREIVCRQVPWLYWWEALVSVLSWAKPQPWRQPLGAWLHQKRTGGRAAPAPHFPAQTATAAKPSRPARTSPVRHPALCRRLASLLGRRQNGGATHPLRQSPPGYYRERASAPQDQQCSPSPGEPWPSGATAACAQLRASAALTIPL